MLADEGQIARRAPMTPATNVREMYVFIPDEQGGGRYVREDYFDNLDDATYKRLMVMLEPFQPQMMSETHLSGKGRDRREARREERRETKAESKAVKAEEKTERKAKRAETLSKVLETVGGVAKNIFGGTDVSGSATFETGERPDFQFKVDDKPFYQKPAFLIGSAAVVGGLIYFLSKRKK